MLFVVGCCSMLGYGLCFLLGYVSYLYFVYDIIIIIIIIETLPSLCCVSFSVVELHSKYHRNINHIYYQVFGKYSHNVRLSAATAKARERAFLAWNVSYFTAAERSYRK